MARFKKRSSSFIDDDDDNSDAPRTSKTTKKVKTASSGLGEGKDADGNPYWELSSKRRIGVSKFKSNLLINIREYYDADGEMKPGKKGISLSIDQYQELLKAVPAINKELRKQGHDIAELDAPVAEAEVAKPAKSKKKTKEPKSNFEATSDEEEDSE